MEIKPVYLFYGEETYLIGRDVAYFLRHFSAADGISTAVRFDGAKTALSAVIDSAEEVPLFGEDRLIIVENAPWFSAGDFDLAPLFAYLEHPSDSTCLVFVAEKADKRLKIVKAIEQVGKVRRYDKYKSWELPDYCSRYLARHGKRISASASALLLQMSGEDLGIISGELDKLLLDSGEDVVIHEDAVERIVAETASANMFHLADAISHRNATTMRRVCLKLLEETPVHEYGMIQGFIANHLRLLIQVKELGHAKKGEKAIAKALNIHEYRVKKALLAVKNYEFDELKRGLQDLMEMDYKIKTGRGTFQELFPLALTRLCLAS